MNSEDTTLHFVNANTFRYDVVTVESHVYHIPDDAIALIHYESSYGDECSLCGALRVHDGKLQIWRNNKWITLCYSSLDELKVQNKSSIIWERSK